ncbi:hypothetical protein ACS0TY_001937 [Phlomoides rotata]
MELVRQRAQRLTLCSFWHPDGHGRGCDNVSDHICIGLTWMHGGVMLMAEGLLGKSNGRSCTINFSKVFQHVPKEILRMFDSKWKSWNGVDIVYQWRSVLGFGDRVSLLRMKRMFAAKASIAEVQNQISNRSTHVNRFADKTVGHVPKARIIQLDQMPRHSELVIKALLSLI